MCEIFNLISQCLNSHKTFYKVEQITTCQKTVSNCPEFKKFYFFLAITLDYMYTDNI